MVADTIVLSGQLVSILQIATGFYFHHFNRLFSTAFGPNGVRQPIAVYARAYIYFMQNLEAHDLVRILFSIYKMN